MNKSNCCEKCTYHAGIAPEKRESQLHGTEFCGNISCKCHTQKATTHYPTCTSFKGFPCNCPTTHEIEGWEKRIKDVVNTKSAIFASFLSDGIDGYDEQDSLVEMLTLTVRDLLTYQQERIVAALEGMKRSQEKILTDMTFEEEQVWNKALTDAIEVVKNHENN